MKSLILDFKLFFILMFIVFIILTAPMDDSSLLIMNLTSHLWSLLHCRHNRKNITSIRKLKQFSFLRSIPTLSRWFKLKLKTSKVTLHRLWVIWRRVVGYWRLTLCFTLQRHCYQKTMVFCFWIKAIQSDQINMSVLFWCLVPC